MIVHRQSLTQHPAFLSALLFVLSNAIHVSAQSYPGSQLQAEVSAAIASNAPLVRLQQGNYYFNEAVFNIEHARDLTLQGVCGDDGLPRTTLWFDIGGGVGVLSSRNLSLVDIAVDYLPTYAQGKLQSVGGDGSSFRVTLNPNMLLLNHSFFQAPYNISIKICFWHPEQRTMLRNHTLPNAINIFLADSSFVEGTTYDIITNRDIFAVIPAPLPTDSIVTLFPRGLHHSVQLINTSNSLLQNVHIHGGTSMGVVDLSGDGNNTFSLLNMTRRPYMTPSGDLVNRVLAINADGFHSTNNRVGPQIRNSVISFTGDDLGNICSGMMVVLGSRIEANGTFSIFVLDNMNILDTLQPPEELFFYDVTDMQQQARGVVSALWQTTDSEMQQRAAQTKEVMSHAPYNVPFVRSILNPPFHVYQIQLTPGAGNMTRVGEYSSLAHFAANANGGGVIENSRIHDGYARVFMLKGRNTWFAHNYVANAGGIHIGPEEVWLEGDPGQTNVTIIDNVFDHIGTPPVSIQPCLRQANATIVIANNTIV